MPPLKPLSSLVLLILATTTYAQTVPTTGPKDVQEFTLQFIQNQPAGIRPNTRQAEMLSLLNRIAHDDTLPVDVVANRGDARQRFSADLDAQTKKLQTALLDATGNAGLPPQEATAEIDRLLATGDRLREKVAVYTDQLDNLRLTLEVKKNKEDAIQKKIAVITAQLAEKIRTDEISLQLAKIADIQQNILDRATEQQKIAIASAADVQARATDLAAAKVRLFQRRDDLATTAAGGALPSLNRILIEVSIEVDEISATVAAVSARLANAKVAARAREDLIALRLRAQTLAALEKLEADMPVR